MLDPIGQSIIILLVGFMLFTRLAPIKIPIGVIRNGLRSGRIRLNTLGIVGETVVYRIPVRIQIYIVPDADLAQVRHFVNLAVHIVIHARDTRLPVLT